MTPWLVLASPICALGVNCAIYLVLRRTAGLPVGVSIVGGISFGFAAAVAFALVGAAHTDIDFLELLTCELGTYMASSFCFWVFLNLNITSLRIRVMRHIRQTGGVIGLSNLLSSYSDLERLQRRLVRLTNGGQIELIDGKWRLRASAILIIARSMNLIRAITGRGGSLKNEDNLGSGMPV